MWALVSWVMYVCACSFESIREHCERMATAAIIATTMYNYDDCHCHYSPTTTTPTTLQQPFIHKSAPRVHEREYKVPPDLKMPPVERLRADPSISVADLAKALKAVFRQVATTHFDLKA